MPKTNKKTLKQIHEEKGKVAVISKNKSDTF